MSKHPIGNVIAMVLRMIGVALGLALMFLAIPIGFLTPILPVGFALFFFGAVMVAGSSATAHRYITGFLRRHPWIWRRVKRFFGDKAEPEDNNP